MQKGFTDIGVYSLFKGVHAATGSIDIPEQGKVVLTIGGQSLDYEDAETSFVKDAQGNPQRFLRKYPIKVFGDIKPSSIQTFL